MDARMVYHKNQNVVEYYEFCRVAGWVNVPAFIGENWNCTMFDYVELIHNGARLNGLYGPHING